MPVRQARKHWCEMHGRDRQAWYAYRHEADWCISYGVMLGRYASPADLALVRLRGRFSRISTGVVRDHMLSRQTGFLMNIPPVVMRHPANCQWITKQDNEHKARQNPHYRDSDSISPDELFTRILEWQGTEWHEHLEAHAAVLAHMKENPSA